MPYKTAAGVRKWYDFEHAIFNKHLDHLRETETTFEEGIDRFVQWEEAECYLRLLQTDPDSNKIFIQHLKERAFELKQLIRHIPKEYKTIAMQPNYRGKALENILYELTDRLNTDRENTTFVRWIFALQGELKETREWMKAARADRIGRILRENDVSRTAIACQICLKIFGGGFRDDCKRPLCLPCYCSFGEDCIQQYLMKHHECPVCRKDFGPLIDALPDRGLGYPEHLTFFYNKREDFSRQH